MTRTITPAHRALRVALAGLAFVAAPRGLPAADAVAPPGTSGARVVELFTSHGCSSCPPADELFGRLVAADPGIVALEYHVDYWNELVHGADGSFVDPLSSPAHTVRQRTYAAAGLAGREGVYTPQIVVDGREAMVGSDARRLGRALTAPAPERVVRVDLAPVGDGARMTARIERAGRALGKADGDTGIRGDGRDVDVDVDVVLVRYRHETRTEITGGENRHRTAVNHRVVHAVERLGALDGDALAFEFAAPPAGEGCAVLVQDRSLATLHAAAACPA